MRCACTYLARRVDRRVELAVALAEDLVLEAGGQRDDALLFLVRLEEGLAGRVRRERRREGRGEEGERAKGHLFAQFVGV